MPIEIIYNNCNYIINIQNLNNEIFYILQIIYNF